MTRMMTRSMYKKLSNEGPPRMSTRSMKNMPQKRFHEDPYPPIKRQRIMKKEESTGVMGVYVSLMYLLLMVWYIAVFSWFVWWFNDLSHTNYEIYLIDYKPFIEQDYFNNTCACE